MDELVSAAQANIHEVTPLLPASDATHGDPSDKPLQPRTRCTWPWKRVVALCAALVIAANIADYLQKAPRIRLYESVICSNHWLNVDPSVVGADGSVPEALCKVDLIQDKLAKILGWQLFFDSIPAILLPIPYGYLADKYGRKWILVVSIIGIMTSLVFVLFVVSLSRIPYRWFEQCLISRLQVGVTNLPLQYVWMSSLFALLGGGGTVATALLLTMVADVTPADKR